MGVTSTSIRKRTGLIYRTYKCECGHTDHDTPPPKGIHGEIHKIRQDIR